MDSEHHELPPEHLPLPGNVVLEGALEIRTSGILGVPMALGSRAQTWARGWFLLVEDETISLRQYASREAVIDGRKPIASWDMTLVHDLVEPEHGGRKRSGVFSSGSTNWFELWFTNGAVVRLNAEANSRVQWVAVLLRTCPKIRSHLADNMDESHETVMGVSTLQLRDGQPLRSCRHHAVTNAEVAAVVGSHESFLSQAGEEGEEGEEEEEDDAASARERAELERQQMKQQQQPRRSPTAAAQSSRASLLPLASPRGLVAAEYASAAVAAATVVQQQQQLQLRPDSRIEQAPPHALQAPLQQPQQTASLPQAPQTSLQSRSPVASSSAGSAPAPSASGSSLPSAMLWQSPHLAPKATLASAQHFPPQAPAPSHQPPAASSVDAIAVALHEEARDSVLHALASMGSDLSTGLSGVTEAATARAVRQIVSTITDSNANVTREMGEEMRSLRRDVEGVRAEAQAVRREMSAAAEAAAAAADAQAHRLHALQALVSEIAGGMEVQLKASLQNGVAGEENGSTSPTSSRRHRDSSASGSSGQVQESLLMGLSQRVETLALSVAALTTQRQDELARTASRQRSRAGTRTGGPASPNGTYSPPDNNAATEDGVLAALRAHTKRSEEAFALLYAQQRDLSSRVEDIASSSRSSTAGVLPPPVPPPSQQQSSSGATLFSPGRGESRSSFAATTVASAHKASSSVRSGSARSDAGTTARLVDSYTSQIASLYRDLSHMANAELSTRTGCFSAAAAASRLPPGIRQRSDISLVLAKIRSLESSLAQAQAMAEAAAVVDAAAASQ